MCIYYFISLYSIFFYFITLHLYYDYITKYLTYTSVKKIILEVFHQKKNWLIPYPGKDGAFRRRKMPDPPISPSGQKMGGDGDDADEH